MAVSSSVVFATVYFLTILIEIPIVILFRNVLRKYWLDFGKVWSVGLNSNTGQGEVRLVKPKWDGFKSTEGWEVPTEMNFGYKDTGKLTFGANIFVWDKGTGLLLRPATGETEQSDPSVKDTKNLTSAINKIQQAGDPLPIIPALIILGVVMLAGFAIIGFMLNGR